MLETYLESAGGGAPSMIALSPACDTMPRSVRRCRVARPHLAANTDVEPSSVVRPKVVGAQRPRVAGKIDVPSVGIRRCVAPVEAPRAALPPEALSAEPSEPAQLSEEAAPEELPTLSALNPETVALVQQYAHVVRRIAAQIHRRSPPSVQRDDLIAAGMGGLWDAVRRRGAQRDENFDYYVCTRVRGAIIDELRTEDWLPRRRLSADGATRTSAGTSIVYFEDLGCRDQRKLGSDSLLDGEQEVENRMALERVMDGLSRLPARERYVLLMRDVEGVPIKDLGEELGVSRPRICQLRTQALRRLREFLAPAA